MSVFYWCVGQDDNIGDVVLRRRMLDALRPLGPVHTLVGPATPGFIEGLGLDPGDALVYRSRARWLLGAYRAALGRGFVLAFDPGEVYANRSSALSHVAFLPLQVLAKVRRGRSVRAAVSLVDADRIWAVPVRASARLCDLNAWRVPPPGLKDSRGRLMPDWAFDEVLTGPAADGTDESGDRRELLVSLRYNRPKLEDAAVEALRRFAAERDLGIVVFNQVRRDAGRSIELADRLGATVDIWPKDLPHLAREQAVRRRMRTAAAVVSDRLHALIIGAVEGAVPIGLLTQTDTKIGPHFHVAGIDDVSADVRGMDADAIEAFLSSVVDRRPEILAAIQRARDAVRTVEADLVALGRRSA